jgi:DNA-binding NarL/FixJ family response regulator
MYHVLPAESVMPASPSSVIRVAIVDDQKSIAQSLQQVLGYSPKVRVVFTARSGIDFLEKMKHAQSEDLPEIVIMDVNMPEMNGLEAVRQGKALYPHLQFIMLTVFDDDETVFEAIRAGASGYLLKDERGSVILTHIENLVENGGVPMSPKIARKTLDLLATSGTPVAGTQLIALEILSAREKDVLYLLVDGLEYKEIGEKLHISPHTVRKHIANIYDKLHISSKVQAIRLMQGSRIAPDPETSTRHRILLVDDHQIILDSLSMMVGTFPGMQVIGKLNNPLDVCEFLAANPTDLVVTDLSMPHLNGLQLATLIKSKFPFMKILILTVSEATESAMEAMAVGVDGYILKKSSKDELKRAIENVLAGNKHFGISVTPAS